MAGTEQAVAPSAGCAVIAPSAARPSTHSLLGVRATGYCSMLFKDAQ